MAMIQCPECGQEISDKAKKCIHCGKVLVEEPKKFCSECGKEIPLESEECPFCGCPVEKEKNENEVVNKIVTNAKQNKKKLTLIGGIVAAIIVLILVINFAGSSLNAEEQMAYQNAVELKSMMKDPDSFKLYDEMFLLKHYDDNGDNDYTYTIFKYGGANGYGAITTDEAIFKDGQYIMDYADEPEEDEIEKRKAALDIKIWQSNVAFGVDNGEWEKVDIDIEKIKDKMGLE